MYEPSKKEMREALQELIDSGEALSCGGKTALLARKMGLTNYVPIVMPAVPAKKTHRPQPQRKIFGGDI